MPIVPRYNGPQVEQNSLPNARLEAHDATGSAANQAQQSINLGRNMQQFGGAIGRIALDMQQEANQLRINDAQNKAKEIALNLKYDNETGYTNIRGYDALQRPSGKPLADEYGETYQKQIEAISDTLGNDAQKQAFQQWSNDQLVGFKGGIVAHEANEFTTYSLSVSEGRIDTDKRTIALEGGKGDIDAVQGPVKSIGAETYRMGRLLGWSAEMIEAQVRHATSGAHTLAVVTALQNGNIGYADLYLDKYSEQMNADDLLKVRGMVTQEMNIELGTAKGGELLQDLQYEMGSHPLGDVFKAMLAIESSGGNQFNKEGKPLISPAGAVGSAQVMIETAIALAKKHGVKFDEYRFYHDKAYNEQYGMWTLEEEVQRYGGDLEKALAAYNYGSPKLNKAIAQANKPENVAAGKTYKDFLPQETKDYLRLVTNQLNKMQSQRAVLPSKREMYAQLDSSPQLKNNPAAMKVARSHVDTGYDLMIKEREQRNEESVLEAQKQLQTNGGRYEDLPVSLREKIPADKRPGLMDYGASVNRPAVTSNPWLYQKLANPDYLKSLTDSEFFMFRKDVSESDFKHFSNERAKLKGSLSASDANSPTNLNSAVIKRTMDSRLSSIGVNPNPKEGSNDAMRMGETRQAADHYILSIQQELGRRLTDAETVTHLDKLLAQNHIQKGVIWDSKVPNAVLQVSDLEASEVDGIKIFLAAQQIHNPTNAQILAAYWATANKQERDKQITRDSLRDSIDRIPNN